jgi:hypothetical protein
LAARGHKLGPSNRAELKLGSHGSFQTARHPNRFDYRRPSTYCWQDCVWRKVGKTPTPDFPTSDRSAAACGRSIAQNAGKTSPRGVPRTSDAWPRSASAFVYACRPALLTPARVRKGGGGEASLLRRLPLNQRIRASHQCVAIGRPAHLYSLYRTR